MALYAFAYFVTAVLSTVIAMVAWRRRTTPGSVSLGLFMLAVAEWAVAGALEIQALDIPAKIFWSQVAYLGTLSSPVLFLIFVAQYTQQSHWLNRRNAVLLWIIPLVNLGIAFTNEWHGAIWNSFTFADDNILIYGHGAWFWVTLAYSYAMVVGGILLLVKAYLAYQSIQRQQMGALILISCLPFIASAIYASGSSPVRGLDITPIALMAVGGGIAWIISRYHFLDLLPVARNALIESMDDGLIVLDTQNRILDINPAGRKFLNVSKAPIGERVEQVWASLQSQWDDFSTRSEIRLPGSPPRWLEVQTSSLPGKRNNFTGRLVILHEITQRKNMQAALEEMNAGLERIVNERTAQLQTTISDLKKEIAEREQAEQALRKMEQMLATRVAEQSRSLAGLYEVSLVAGQSLSIDDLQGQVLRKIVAVLAGDAGCIHQLDTHNGVLKLGVQHGLSTLAQEQIQTLPAAWLLGDRIPLNVSDLAPDTSVPPTIRASGFRAYIGIPIYLIGRVTGTLSILWNQPHSFSVDEIALFSAMADQLGIITENARLRHRGEQAAAIQERRRLARDLHDSITQSLHSLVLSTETASNRLRLGKLDLLKESLSQQTESARQAVKEMRLFLFELRLATLDEVNLVEAISTRLDAVERKAGVQVQFQVEPLTLTKTYEKEIYCIAMEALNNSLKHSRATKLNVRLCKSGDKIELDIADNGKGIEPYTTRLGGLGLQSMSERAERLKGKLSITSDRGTGTRVHLELAEVK